VLKRHIAELALLGWYLMTPPPHPEGQLDFAAPVSAWMVQHVYDKARDCDADRTAWRERAAESGWGELEKWHAAHEKLTWSEKQAILKSPSGPPEGKEPDMTLGTYQVLAHAVCIASDDPRLAK
jgi:hypothetical protein